MLDYMKLAIDQARIAYLNGEVPVGAVIVKNGKVLFSSCNKKNVENVSVFHAEILCIIGASKKIGSWYLDDCDLYVTLKPCNMCMYAIAEARIKNVYYLLESNYVENLNKNYSKIMLKRLDDLYNYDNMLSSFFKKLRSDK